MSEKGPRKVVPWSFQGKYIKQTSCSEDQHRGRRSSSQAHLGIAEGGRLFTEVVQTHSAAQLIYRGQTSELPTSQRGPENRLALRKTSLTGSTEQPSACSTYITLKRPKGWLGAVIKYTFLLFLHAYHNCLPPRVPQGSISIQFHLSPTKTRALHFISQASI